MMKMDDVQSAYWEKISSTALTSAMDDSEVRLSDIKGKFLLNPMIAAGAMVASSVFVVTNSLRLKKLKR